MSLKLRALRKSKNIKKIDFAKKIDVNIRTVANWERKDGVVPSLGMMKEISKVLDTNTYEIFSCFVYDPDDIEEENGFHFQNHSKDIHVSFKSPARPFQLFKYIKEFRLTGEGFIIYQYRLFRFAHLYLHDLSPSTHNIDDANYLIKPSDGFVVEDENANSIILEEGDILEWRILSYEDKIHTVFEISTNTVLLPEMADEISQNGKCVIYLDAYQNNKESFLPYRRLSPLEIIENTNNVIGTVIRKCRERKGFTLKELSQDLQEYYPESFSSKTISRWETGELKPSAGTLANLLLYFDLSAEKVLDAYHNDYYTNNIIEPFSHCYYLGLNLLFGNIKDYSSLLIFIRNFIFYNMTKYSESILRGHISSDLRDENISQLSIEDSHIVIGFEAGGSILLDETNLIKIVPISIHFNTCYELSCDIDTYGEKTTYSIYLLFNFSKPNFLD